MNSFEKVANFFAGLFLSLPAPIMAMCVVFLILQVVLLLILGVRNN